MTTYIVNENTSKIHIEGYCHYASTKGNNVRTFKTEQAARDFYGGDIIHCKVCWKKRDSDR